jgi:hypothetical protein
LTSILDDQRGHAVCASRNWSAVADAARGATGEPVVFDAGDRLPEEAMDALHGGYRSGRCGHLPAQPLDLTRGDVGVGDRKRETQ